MMKFVSVTFITIIIFTACNGKSKDTDQSTLTAMADQSTPQTLAEAIFSAARNGDLSQLKNICDIPSEADRDSKEICEIINADDKSKESFKIYYSNGKVDGEPLIEGDKARLNIKLSSSESSLIFVRKVFNMAKKDGKWFLIGVSK
ncbi:MAG: hypothetical protein ABI666_06455 [Ferruginibacter sp.]